MAILVTHTEPLFSIVTVCLNPGKDLHKTIASILVQSFEDYEIIIKDGGSVDGTREICWEDHRIQFFSIKDEGIFHAMNQSLDLCRGEYVIFLNAGDCFFDNDVLADFKSAVHKNCSTVFFFGDVYKEQGRSKINIYPDRLNSFFLFSRMICHQTWCVRRSTYLSHGGFETKLPIGGDSRLFLKMLMKDKVKYKHIRRVVVTYQGDGLSTQKDLILKSQQWEDDLKRHLFSKIQYKKYSLMWSTWLRIKSLLYDKFLFLPWKLIQHLRA